MKRYTCRDTRPKVQALENPRHTSGTAAQKPQISGLHHEDRTDHSITAKYYTILRLSDSFVSDDKARRLPYCQPRLFSNIFPSHSPRSTNEIYFLFRTDCLDQITHGKDPIEMLLSQGSSNHSFQSHQFHQLREHQAVGK